MLDKYVPDPSYYLANCCHFLYDRMAPRCRAGKEPAIEAGPSHVAEDEEMEQFSRNMEDEDYAPGAGSTSAPRSGYYEVFGPDGVGTELRGTIVPREVREADEDVVDTPLLGRLSSHPSMYLCTQVVPLERTFRGSWFQAIQVCNQAHDIYIRYSWWSRVLRTFYPSHHSAPDTL